MITGAMRRPPSLLPWILFGVTAGVLVALAFVLLRQASVERERADEQAQAHANETARAEKAEIALTQLRAKVEPLQTQLEALTAERDELSGRVRAMALDAAKATPDGTKSAVAKPPATKTAKKKPVKKKRRR